MQQIAQSWTHSFPKMPSCCQNEPVPFVVSDEHAVKHLSPALGSSFIASSAYQKQPPWGGIGWAFPWGRRQGALALKYVWDIAARHVPAFDTRERLKVFEIPLMFLFETS